MTNEAPLSRRALRAQRGRTARRRPSALIGSTLVTALVVVTAATAVGGTYALLTAQGTVTGATVTAATLGLQVNGASTAALGDWQVGPTTAVAKSFAVKNDVATSGISPVPVKLAATIAVTSSSAITANTTAVITRVADAGACVTGLGTRAALSGYAYADASALPAIAPGATAYYCLEVGLNANTPLAQSGLGTGFTVTLTSTQVVGP